MTDYLIKTDGTSSGLTLGSAIADTDAIEIQQSFVAPATTLHQTFAAVKTWIKSWIAKADVGLSNVSNNAQLTIANNLSDVASADSSRVNLGVGFGMPKNRFYTFTDCVINPGSGVLSDHWRADWSGGQVSSLTVGSFNGLGIYSFDAGGTATGRGALGSTALACMKLGSGQARFAARFAIHVLSNGTDTYTARVGFLDSHTGESTDGCFFRYTDGTNAGKWQAVARSNGTETATDTGVTPVADTFQRFEIVVNAGGTSVDFNIDGVTKATITTNIPTGAGRELGYGVMTLKSVGTTNISMGYLDYAEVECNFTAAR